VEGSLSLPPPPFFFFLFVRADENGICDVVWFSNYEVLARFSPKSQATNVLV